MDGADVDNDLDHNAGVAYLESLWDVAARARLAARDDEVAAAAAAADDWLTSQGRRVLVGDEHDRWMRRFAAVRASDAADAFHAAPDTAVRDPFRDMPFDHRDGSSHVVVHAVECSATRTRLRWSRPGTTPEQALADADTDLVDDRGSAYVLLGVAGGSDGELGYAALSTFVPAIPVGAEELVFRVGSNSVRLRLTG